MRFTTSLFFSLCAVTSIVGNAFAVPLELKTREVFDPLITFPAGGEQFTAGQTITVTWDTSELPANLTNLGMIVLAKPKGDSENLFLDGRLNGSLASGFLLTAGHQDITFPSNLTRGHNYAIVLFGDSGNISNDFTIKPARQPHN